MRKVWVSKRQRRGRVEWYVMWYDDARRLRAKRCQNSVDANRLRITTEQAVNNGGVVAPERSNWPELVEAFIHYKGDVQGREPATIKVARDTYNNFERIVGPIQSQHFNKQVVHDFVAARRKEVSPATVNKDLRNLKMLVRWAISEGYMGMPAVKINWKDIRQMEVKHKVRTASMTELLRVLYAAKKLYGMHWYLRIVLAISTGIRQQDIERLTVSDVNTADATFASLNRKAHKFDEGKPMHNVLTRLLGEYIRTLPKGQKRLWPDQYHHSKWDRIKEQAGVDNSLKYHSFRASFVSFILRAGYSTSVAQDLVEHSTPILTNQVYADLSPVYRDAVNAVPLEQMERAIEQAAQSSDPLTALDELAKETPAARPGHPTYDTAPDAP